LTNVQRPAAGGSTHETGCSEIAVQQSRTDVQSIRTICTATQSYS